MEVNSMGNANDVEVLILKELKRGATITNSIGAHSGEENVTITCIISRSQISKLKEIIKEKDNNSGTL